MWKLRLSEIEECIQHCTPWNIDLEVRPALALATLWLLCHKAGTHWDASTPQAGMVRMANLQRPAHSSWKVEQGWARRLMQGVPQGFAPPWMEREARGRLHVSPNLVEHWAQVGLASKSIGRVGTRHLRCSLLLLWVFKCKLTLGYGSYTWSLGIN